MAISKIQYDDKVAINIDSTIPDINKCNASDLNEIKSVVNNNADEIPSNDNLVNVGSSVDTDYKVNVLTTKNLFNINEAHIENGYIDTAGMVLITSQLNRLFYIPCKPNTTYTISRSIITSTFRVATYDSTPFPSTTSSSLTYSISGLIKNDSSTSITITTGANAKYLIVHYGRLQTDPNIEESLATIQVEYGNQATTYEAFIPNTINVNNEKYTDTINVGTDINSANRVNVIFNPNLFNKNDVVAGYLSNAGNVISNVNYSTSNFIEIGEATKITINNSSGNNENICFYDNTQTFVSYQATGTNITLTIDVPNNAKYIRATINNTNLNIYEIQRGTSIITPSINIDGEEIYSKPVVLYNNNSGSNGNIDLLDNTKNYSYIKIFYGSGDQGFISALDTLPGSYVLLSTIDMRNSVSQSYIRGCLKQVNETTITNAVYSNVINYGTIKDVPGGTSEFRNENTIKIYKVLGFK